jgi:hypothetical protein
LSLKKTASGIECVILRLLSATDACLVWIWAVAEGNDRLPRRNFSNRYKCCRRLKIDAGTDALSRAIDGGDALSNVLALSVAGGYASRIRGTEDRDVLICHWRDRC